MQDWSYGQLILLCQSIRNSVACTDSNKHYQSFIAPYYKDGPEWPDSGLNPKSTPCLPNSGFRVLFSHSSNTKSHRHSHRNRDIHIPKWELSSIYGLNWILLPITNDQGEWSSMLHTICKISSSVLPLPCNNGIFCVCTCLTWASCTLSGMDYWGNSAWVTCCREDPWPFL